jgi:hypothetical protein
MMGPEDLFRATGATFLPVEARVLYYDGRPDIIWNYTCYLCWEGQLDRVSNPVRKIYREPMLLYSFLYTALRGVFSLPRANDLLF